MTSQQTKCRLESIGLLGRLNAKTVTPDDAMSFIADIMATEECDKYHNLKSVRDSTEKERKLAEERADYGALEVDMPIEGRAKKDGKIALFVFFHHQRLYEKELLRSLSGPYFPSWIRCKYSLLHDDFWQAAVLGALTGSVLGYAGVGNRGLIASSVLLAVALTKKNAVVKKINEW